MLQTLDQDLPNGHRIAEQKTNNAERVDGIEGNCRTDADQAQKRADHHRNKDRTQGNVPTRWYIGQPVRERQSLISGK